MNREEIEKIMKELYLQGETYEEIGRAIGVSAETARGRIRNRDYYSPYTRDNLKEIEFDNFTIDSENEDLKRKLMEDAGLNYDDWEITRARISSWDMAGREEPGKSVKLTVSPKKPIDEIKYEKIAEDIEKIKPIKLSKQKISGKNNLVIPLFDMHFGTSDLEHYKPVLSNIKEHIDNNKFNNILIICGGDLLNEDNYNGTTASGTNIGKTNMHQAWLDCFEFISTIIKFSYNKCNNLRVLYVEGNHDTFSGHTVLLSLEKYFDDSDIEFDTSKDVFKSVLLDNVMICATHGHKANLKKLPLIYATNFPVYWSKSKTRECFTGHFHHEIVSQDIGIVLRQMPVRNVKDQWSKDNGFTTSQDKMFIVEYTADELKAIIVV